MTRLPCISAACGLVLAVGCGSKTTAPSDAVVSVSLSQQSATIPRNGTLQLTATSISSDGATSDATASATWASSNTAVATIANGLVTILAPGTAQILATVQGHSASATITGRRRTHLNGVFSVTDTDGASSITGMGVFIDDVWLLDSFGSSPLNGSSQWSLDIHNSKRVLSPGAHVVTVKASLINGAYTISSAPTTLSIVDTDTGEIVGSIVLAAASRLIHSSTPGVLNEESLSWQVTVAEFDQ